MESAHDPAVDVASQSGVEAATVPASAVAASHPVIQPYTKAQITAKLAAIGVTGVTKKFPTSEEAKEFIKANMFLQSRSQKKGSQHTKFFCVGCEFVARLYVNVADEAQLTLPDEPRWHDAECARCAKGRHGLSKELRATALLEKPRSCVEKELKRVATATVKHEPHVKPEEELQPEESVKPEDGPKPTPEVKPVVHVVGVTARQVTHVRRYEAGKHNEMYEKDPEAFFAKKFPGSTTSVGTHENARVMCGIRPGLVSDLIKQDQICVDATYWIAPRNGNVVTIGYTQYDSFIPVFFAVFEPLVKGEKCTETGESFKYAFEQFHNLVRSTTADVPAAAAWVPRVAVRDHACAIRNGLRAVFKDCQDFVCYFHVKQALERWLVEHHVCDELKKDMHRVMETLHFTTDMETYLLGLRVAQEKLITPLWKEFFLWNTEAHRMPGGACERWTLAYTQPHDTTTNCGIERWHGHLKSRVRCSGSHTFGHLGLRDCVELLLREFGHIELLLHGKSPRLEMPLYFEVRERLRGDELAAATRNRVEYLHELQRSATVGQSTFRWTRRSTPEGQSSVVLLDTFAHGVVVGHRGTGWGAFLASQAVHVTTKEACSCIAFKTNAFMFCKHVIAVQGFLLVCPLREVPAATPPERGVRPATETVIDTTAELAPSATHPTTGRGRSALQSVEVNTAEPARVRVLRATVKSPSAKRSRSRAGSYVGDVTPEVAKSWTRPPPRRENALQQQR